METITLGLFSLILVVCLLFRLPTCMPSLPGSSSFVPMPPKKEILQKRLFQCSAPVSSQRKIS